MQRPWMMFLLVGVPLVTVLSVLAGVLGWSESAYYAIAFGATLVTMLACFFYDERRADRARRHRA